ncbi:MAG: toll/interleukin-1 receptor domain-containing protein [Nitrospira sp.]|nr:toll/interleukin-1 receptor domain-containing protein [Nitrospira sp.]
MDSLLASKQSLTEALGARKIIPIIGPDIVLVDNANGSFKNVPFYGLVADELLRYYKCKLPESEGNSSTAPWLLHRSVAQVLADSPGESMEKIRRTVSSIVKSLSSNALSSPLLERLARLRSFDVFISLTPDDFLVKALQEVLGGDNVTVVTYAPSNDTSQPLDLVEKRGGGAQVFFPLGRSAVGTRLAVHEEDALEYFYRFQEECPRRAPNLLSELRERDLLLLGCNLPNWLGRGFLRFASEGRLSSQEKGKMEFFAADARDPALNGFLARFDPNATVFPWSPEEFIVELEALVKLGTHPSQNLSAVDPVQCHAALPVPTVRAPAAPTVFISYASEDAAAARCLADGLLDLGFGDVWLDQRKLIAGDDWSDKIDEAIQRCDFFLPVLSRQADRRREGVFWEEWRKAAARALRVNDAFLLPTGIDATPPDRSDYERIFNGYTIDFRRIHLIHAPDGQLSADDIAKLRERCARFHEARNG